MELGDKVGWEVGQFVLGEMGGRDSTGVGDAGGVVTLEVVRRFRDTGTGRGRARLSCSSRRETQATGLGSSDNSSSSESLWLSTMSFLSLTRLSASFGFLGIFDALWIMCVRAGEICFASLVLLATPFPANVLFLGSGFFLSASYLWSGSGLLEFEWLILRALAFAFSSAALMKASSPSSFGFSFAGVGKAQ